MLPDPVGGRRRLIATRPIEIAASTAMAIKIGTSGEEPPSSALDEG